MPPEIPYPPNRHTSSPKIRKNDAVADDVTWAQKLKRWRAASNHNFISAILSANVSTTGNPQEHDVGSPPPGSHARISVGIIVTYKLRYFSTKVSTRNKAL